MNYKSGSAVIALVCLVAGFRPAGVDASYKDDIGFTRLAAELGPGVPTGTNITVTQVESPIVVSTNYFVMPEPSEPAFAGKSFENRSGAPTNGSWHATEVGRNLYGANSIASSINLISVYDANHWLTNGYLHRYDTSFEPDVETNRIQNHSWVGDSSARIDIIRRLDYAIVRDGFTAVVALHNIGAFPQDLLAHSYNAIVVGKTSGEHNAGLTVFDEPGRIKPDIVAPLSGTSYSAGLISAAAALMMQTADDNPSLTNATRPECIKALLMAGATKTEFPGWDRTTARPLDDVYGAGELNVYNSYYILTGGEQPADESNTVSLTGWHYGSASGSVTSRYFFAVPPTNVMVRISAMLTWNRNIYDLPSAGFNPLASLADLSLKFYSASNFVPIMLLDESTSAVDNVEHIYQQNLQPGQYALEVAGDSATNYCLAWFGQAGTTPGIASVGLTNGQFTCSVDLTTGYDYIVEATTNLLDTNGWSVLETNTPGVSPYYYVDTDSTNVPLRFYRFTVH
jgi:hypothetical protein